MTGLLARFLNRLLGARCALGCGLRVFPADVAMHAHIEHAGDVQ
ncbi:hypothetical protein QWY28_17490 [Nocardioides sp. SOB77]|uniref:C2H2-type domain-containing protein n=1 Tax=Nocardioides oceani TaxID=3058369 RepID=A0ABT8FJQ1_9ACTN|nr:hypothetical protein [Nocardioides oceani]MDN4174759.1 hypothetical protein [Nocardioides oceani]